MNLQGFLFWLWLLMPICWLMGMGSRQQGKKSCVISTFCARSIAQPQCWAWIETLAIAVRAVGAQHRPASVLGVD